MQFRLLRNYTTLDVNGISVCLECKEDDGQWEYMGDFGRDGSFKQNDSPTAPLFTHIHCEMVLHYRRFIIQEGINHAYIYATRPVEWEEDEIEKDEEIIQLIK